MKKILQGIVIGAGAIIPGISSGVMCVLFNLYEKLLDSVLNFFKNPKANFKFLFPIIVGVIIGVIAFSNILNYILYIYPIQTKSIFIGLILGTIPMLIRDVNEKEKFKKSNIIFLSITLLIGIFGVFLEKNIAFKNIENVDYIYLIISGIAMSIGVIVPGVSSTIILMIFGVYSIYLKAISIVYFPVLIPIGIGLILGSIFFMKITDFLLSKYYAKTFYAIIGFTLGSIFVLTPDITNTIEICISVLCIILGLEVSKILR